MSGPILDRFDVTATTEGTDADDIFNPSGDNESSAIIRQRVTKARAIQNKRLVAHPGIRCNADLSHELIQQHCALDDHARKFLQRSWDKLQLSMRRLDKVLKVARTIADLAGMENVELPHVAEALYFRMNDDSNSALQEKSVKKQAV